MLDDTLYCALLTIPANLDSAKQTIAHLGEIGFPEPEIFLNTPVVKPKHINEVHRNIFEGHFSIVERFYLNQFRVRRHLHLLIFEDDVRGLSDSARALVLEKVRYLDAHHTNWAVLNLGCAALGPALPIGNGLVMVTSPFSVHAYVVNGKMAGYICRLTRSICERPLFPEGWKIVKMHQRIATFTPVFTQIRTPKEFFLKNVPVVNKIMTYERTLVLLMWISCSFCPIFILVLGLVVWRLFSKLKENPVKPEVREHSERREMCY